MDERDMVVPAHLVPLLRGPVARARDRRLPPEERAAARQELVGVVAQLLDDHDRRGAR